MLYNAPRKNLKNVKEYVPMKKRSFTLVEILVVVGIIVILAGLAIPVISKSMATAKLNQAAAECNSIQLAIKNFETEYSAMPEPDGVTENSNAQYVIGRKYSEIPNGADTSYKRFFTMMIGYPYNDDPNAATPDPTEKLSSTSAEWYNNKKHITFLDPPASYAQKKGYLDPWGKTYFIVYKSDGELQNKLDGLYMTGSNAYPKETLLTPVAVFTREGPYTTKDLDSARYATSWEGVKTY